MSLVYVIADLHFGHGKIALHRGFASQEEHDAATVERWNAVVTKRDVVYVLGDVFNLDPVPKLLGCKKLALGNHDQRPAARYAELFSQVRACFEWDNCLLTHIPVHPNQRRRYRLNVHGHMHDGRVRSEHHAEFVADDFYRCASWEQSGGVPRLLREVTKP